MPAELIVVEVHLRETLVRWLMTEMNHGELSHDTRLSIKECLKEEFKFLRLLRNLLVSKPMAVNAVNNG